MIYHITKEKWKLLNTDKITYVSVDKVPKIIDYLLKEKELAFDTETQGFDWRNHHLFCYQIGNGLNQFIIDHRAVPITAFKDLLETKTLVGINLKFDLKFLFKYGIYPTKVIDCMLLECLLTSGLYTRADVTKLKPYSFQTLSRVYCGDEDIDKSIGASFSIKDYNENLTEKEIIYAAKDVVHPLEIYSKQNNLLTERNLINLAALENDLVISSALTEYEDNDKSIGAPFSVKDYNESLTERNLISLAGLENDFVISLALMEYNGIYLDKSKWLEIQKSVDNKLLGMLKQLSYELGNSTISKSAIRTNSKRVPLFYEYETQGGEFKKICSINWSSPDQVKQVFNLLGVDVDSISQQKILSRKKEHPFISTYLEYKEYASLKAKFTDTLPNYIHPITNRIHTDFWQIVSTGRMSASKPALQQIPSKGAFGKAIRQCFTAEKGNLLVTSDYSGCELRIIAEFSQDPLWLKTFRENGDLHGIIASELFGITAEESKVLDFPMKPGTTYRNVVKTINFGLAYGLTEHKLSDTIGTSVEEAKDLIDTYFKKVPKVRAFLEGLSKSVKKTGMSQTFHPIKRPRYFDMEILKTISKREAQKKLSGYERAAMNAPIQGCNADMIKLAVCKITDYCRKNNFPARLIIILHDELVYEVPEDLAEEWRKIQERFMIEAGEVFIKSIPVVVESNVGPYWNH